MYVNRPRSCLEFEFLLSCSISCTMYTILPLTLVAALRSSSLSMARYRLPRNGMKISLSLLSISRLL